MLDMSTNIKIQIDLIVCFAREKVQQNKIRGVHSLPCFLPKIPNATIDTTTAKNKMPKCGNYFAFHSLNEIPGMMGTSAGVAPSGAPGQRKYFVVGDKCARDPVRVSNSC